MKHFLSLFISICLAFCFTDISAQTKADSIFIEQTLASRGEIVFQFPHSNNRQLVNQLGKIISIDRINDSCVVAYANYNEFEAFKTFNLPYLPDYNYYRQTRAINMATTTAEMANWDRYPTYSLYLQMMQNYANTHSDICRLVNHGQSVGGRDIVTLVISDNVNTNEDEPEFWWSSTMHGDETAGWYFLIRLIDYLLTNYGSNQQVTNIVDNIEIHISPNTNPDGTFFRSENSTSISQARRYNRNNVDLNRNFPFINGTATNGNQPEITLMTAYADAHNFVMSANGHGGDECLNYPWDEDGWTHATRPNADDNWWTYIANEYVDTVHNIANNLMTGPSDVPNANGVIKGSEWYSIDGGRQDYMNYYKHCKEITMEWSSEKKLASEDLNSYWNAHFQAMLNLTEEVLYGFNGIVTDACNGEPLGNVNVFINNHDTDNTDIFTSQNVGDYHRPIYAGTYDVTFSKQGYQAKTLSITTQNKQSTRLDVQLVPTNTQIIDLGEPITQCGGEIIIDAGNNYDSYIWSNNSENQTITVYESGNYRVTATHGECSFVGEKNITINAIPHLEISIQDNVLEAITNEECSFLWSNNQTLQTITATEETEYCVTATNTELCQNTACVSYVLPPYGVEILQTENGSIIALNEPHWGENFTFTVTPDSCYNINCVVVNDDTVQLEANNRYTIPNLNAEYIVTAHFTKKQFVINASANLGGNIFPNGDVVVPCGNNQLFTFTANDGFYLANIIIDNVQIESTTNYTFNNVTANGHSIVAVFEEIIVPPICNAPISMTAILESYGVHLSWNMVENAVSYNIYRDNELIATTNSNSYIDLDGNVANSYYITTECCNGGLSEASEIIVVEEITVPTCNVPTSLNAIMENYGIHLSWDSVENAVSFNVYRNNELIATTSSNSYIDLTGSEVDNYYVTVECNNGSTSEASEIISAATTNVGSITRNLQIYPNPCNNELIIRAEEEILEIEIFSVLGQQLSLKNVNSNYCNVDMRTFESGVYFLKLHFKNENSVRRIVKE